MPTMFVGDYIKRRRKELELTQEQLCEGICDAVNVTVAEPPVFSTVEKFVSEVLIPTGTRPLPHATHVPPK